MPGRSAERDAAAGVSEVVGTLPSRFTQPVHFGLRIMEYKNRAHQRKAGAPYSYKLVWRHDYV